MKQMDLFGHNHSHATIFFQRFSTCIALCKRHQREQSLCSSVYVCMLILQKRENGHKPRTVKEVLPKQNFAYRPCFCLCAACQDPLCLLSPARSPSGAPCCLISQPKQHFYLFIFLPNVLPFLVYTVVWSHCSLLDPIAY